MFHICPTKRKVFACGAALGSVEENKSFRPTELCSVAAGNFAQSFMGKKSKLLIENLLSYKRWWFPKAKPLVGFGTTSQQ